jgi:site-specific DNA-methyltransferase (cytosine-N4-specific)
MTITVHEGDCRLILPTLAAKSVQTVITSPPYWDLRNYQSVGQIGAEEQSRHYIETMKAVFDEVRRVLRDDGTLWLNLADTRRKKELLGIPWAVATALRGMGWRIRSEIIWAKANPTPESAKDRPTSSHETIFLLTKAHQYYYDGEPIREAIKESNDGDIGCPVNGKRKAKSEGPYERRVYDEIRGANCRDVWIIPTEVGNRTEHCAIMPREIARRCILAGSRPGDLVLDPFAGSGTTGVVADRLGRNAELIELNPEHLDLTRERVIEDAPLFARVTTAQPSAQLEMF